MRHSFPVMNDLFLFQTPHNAAGKEHFEHMGDLLVMQHARNMQAGVNGNQSKVTFYHQPLPGIIQSAYQLMRRIPHNYITQATALQESPLPAYWQDHKRLQGMHVLIGEQDWLNDIGSHVATLFFTTQPATHVTDEQNYAFQLYSGWGIKNRATADEGRVNRQRGPILFSRNDKLQAAYLDYAKHTHNGNLASKFTLHQLRK